MPEDSFYGRLGFVQEVLFEDEEFSDMYADGEGRPSLAPSLMSGVLLLQFHDDVSDKEAVQRTLYDLRWKVTLHLPLDYEGFDSSSLCRFRNRLLEHGKERYVFDRFVEGARSAVELAEGSEDEDVQLVVFLLTKIMGDDLEMDEEDEPELPPEGWPRSPHELLDQEACVALYEAVRWAEGLGLPPLR